MTTPRLLAVAAAFLLPLVASAASPIDGTWTGQIPGREGPLTLTFTFKAEGGSVTGSVRGDNAPSPIVSGSIKGNAFDFKIVVNGVTVAHTCTINGDTIDMSYTFGGQPASKLKLVRSAAAPAVAQAPGPDPTGTWKWTVTPPGAGMTFEVSCRMAYADGKLTGTYMSRNGEAPITEASFKDGALSFSVVRERDGTSFTVRYKGILSGDTITGTLDLPAFGGGDGVTVPWKATRAR
jgi:hypothetical protein